MTPQVCFPFVGTLVGGSHISAAGLIAHLDPTRFQPLVVLQHGEGAIADLMSDSGIAFETAPPTARLVHGRPVGAAATLGLLAASPRLARFLRERGVDIVHCNDGRTLATWALAARLAGCRRLWHHRGSPDATGLRLVAPLLADRVVAVSSFASPRPGWYSAAPRSCVIHSPFDTDIAPDRAEARRALAALLPEATPATRIVAFAGALIERKRPLLFVEAIAAMHRREPGLDLRGVLLGDSPDGLLEAAQDRAMQLGIADRVHFMGYRTPGPFWLAACDMLMVPAVDEPFGRTLIEAQLVGTPVVATASGGNIEAIVYGRSGLLVPPEDAEALAEACLSLFADPDRCTRLAASARTDAQARFGEQRHADAVMAVYDGMLRRSAQPHASPPEGPIALTRKLMP